MRDGQSGQAAVEWLGVLLVLALGLGALATIAPPSTGARWAGSWLTGSLAP